MAPESEIIVFDKLGNTFKQIVDALMYGHKAGWLHEIKENVLLHKIAEKEWKPERDRSQTNPKRYQLTEAQKAFYKMKHPWIAPELIQGTHDQSNAPFQHSSPKIILFLKLLLAPASAEDVSNV